VNTGSWNALNLSATEVHPTAVRATAVGFVAAIGRLGAALGTLLFGVMATSSATLPLFVSAASLMLSAAVAATLPETREHAMT